MVKNFYFRVMLKTTQINNLNARRRRPVGA
jgi:hypothetical protein